MFGKSFQTVFEVLAGLDPHYPEGVYGKRNKHYSDILVIVSKLRGTFPV